MTFPSLLPHRLYSKHSASSDIFHGCVSTFWLRFLMTLNQSVVAENVQEEDPGSGGMKVSANSWTEWDGLMQKPLLLTSSRGEGDDTLNGISAWGLSKQVSFSAVLLLIFPVLLSNNICFAFKKLTFPMTYLLANLISTFIWQTMQGLKIKQSFSIN